MAETSPLLESTPARRNSFLTGNHLLRRDSLFSADEESLLDEVRKAEITSKTTIFHEMIIVAKSSSPVIVTSLLQNSFYLASIASVGHIGKVPLAGVTLGSMTASITGFSFIMGLATCLDTLCSQAHGAGKYDLVGMHFLRCTVFTICFFIPIGIIWLFFSDQLLGIFIKNDELLEIASGYLKIVTLGVPGFILFECGKRYIQCQGVFHAGTYVLLVCAPLNILMNYAFVWEFGLGYIGAPLAVAINYWLMPLGLLIFIIFNQQYLKCWPSGIKFSDAFTNWGTMVELALPGLVMVEAEFIGFEVITLASSRLGTTELAAQSILSSICSVVYQIPFSISISTATRVANFIGANLPNNGRKAAKASLCLGVVTGLINSVLIVSCGRFILKLFTSDEEVTDMVYKALHVMSVVTFADCLNETSAGGLKGLGLQRIGGKITFFSYYALGIPCSFLFCFKFGMGIPGLWLGIALSLAMISFLQVYTVFYWSDWDELVKEAERRNTIT
uniref:MATE transporter n=1 Tax=Cyberlindnera americana TaxID=36016 RepID=A0A5P8N995_9ASCO|nr:MATE transporter [Cyberlindnera americana]